jgi:hypothetical protein
VEGWEAVVDAGPSKENEDLIDVVLVLVAAIDSLDMEKAVDEDDWLSFWPCRLEGFPFNFEVEARSRGSGG